MANLELKRQVLTGLKWVTSMRLVGQLYSWIATLVVIRLLAPADYGILALAQLLVGLATLLNEIGLTPALVQARAATSNVVRSVFGYVLLSNTVLYLLVYAAAPGFARFYELDQLTLVIRVLGLQLLIGAAGAVPVALATRRMAFREIAVVGLTATVAGSTASLLVAIVHGTVWALVIANLVMAAVQSVGIILVTRCWIMPSLRLTGMHALLSFGAWVSGSKLAWYFAQSADDLLIGKLLGNHVLGYFNVAKNLAAIPMHRVMEIINQVTFPAYSRLEGDAGLALKYFLTSVWLAMLIFCPVTWGLSSIADVFIDVVLGQKWVGAAFPLRILALSIPLQALSFLLTPAVEALGRPDLAFRNSVVRLIVFPLSIVLVIPWGIDAVACSFVLGRVVALLVFFRIAASVFPLTLGMVWTASRASVAAAAIMYVAVSCATLPLEGYMSDLPLMTTLVVLGAAVYGTVLIALAPGTIKDLKATFAAR